MPEAGAAVSRIRFCSLSFDDYGPETRYFFFVGAFLEDGGGVTCLRKKPSFLDVVQMCLQAPHP